MTLPHRQKSYRKNLGKSARSLASTLEQAQERGREARSELHEARDLEGSTVEILQGRMGNRHMVQALQGGGGTLLHDMSAEALDLAHVGVDARESIPGIAPLSLMASRLHARREALGEIDADEREEDFHAGVGRWSGNPLPPAVRARLEAAFGMRFDAVRVHTDDDAAKSAEAIDARAFALGTHIYFGRGQWNPDSPEGLRLLAHELTHVEQAAEGRLPGASGPGLEVSEPTDSSELEAEARAREVSEKVDSTPTDRTTATAPMLHAPSVDHALNEDAATEVSPAEADGLALAAPELNSGKYTKIELTLKIPTPIPGLTVDVTISGQYMENLQGSQAYIEAEGLVRVAITYKLLFLSLSVFLQGGLKLKVKTNNFQDAMKRGFTDIAHFFAARELANLPKKKGQVVDKYASFEKTAHSLVDGLYQKSEKKRVAELNRFDRGLIFDNALQNIVDARDSLVEGVQSIFADMKGNIDANQIYPDARWIWQRASKSVQNGEVTDDELDELLLDLTTESEKKRAKVNAEMNNIPAIKNDPGVQFEGNLQVGFKAGVDISNAAKASVEIGKGWRISDSMNAKTFDTQAKGIYFASVSLSVSSGGLKMTGDLAYEGVGDKIDEPEEFKVTGKVLVGVTSEIPEKEAAGTLAHLKDRLSGAATGAGKGGQSALTAMKTALEREVKTWHASLKEKAPPKLVGDMKAGFDVQFDLARKNGSYSLKPGENYVRFVTVRSLNGSIGIGEGTIETGQFIGVAF